MLIRLTKASSGAKQWLVEDRVHLEWVSGVVDRIEMYLTVKSQNLVAITIYQFSYFLRKIPRHGLT